MAEEERLKMSIFEFLNKTRADAGMTNLRTPVPIHQAERESWGRGKEGQPFCRICQGSSSANQLVSPCSCKGTLGYVHIICLEKWLNSSSRTSCELCHSRYDILQRRRYTLWESLRLWFRHPVNWRHLQADIIILTLLSIIAIVLIIICTSSLEYFVVEAKKYGVPEKWTKGVLDIFLTLVIMGYLGALGFLIKQQLSPWYYWWTNNLKIQLKMSWSLACLESRKQVFNGLVLDRLDSVQTLVSNESDMCSRENFSGEVVENNCEKPTNACLVTSAS